LILEPLVLIAITTRRLFPAHCKEIDEDEKIKFFTMGSDLQPGCLADRLLTGLGQPLRVTRVTRMAYSPSRWLMAIGW